MNATTLMTKGLISTLPKENRDQVTECYDKIKTLIDEYPDGIGILAITLIGSEMQDQ